MGLFVLSATDADRDRQSRRGPAHPCEDFDKHPRASGQLAAVSIPTPVRIGTEELMQQEPPRRKEFNAVVPGPFGTHGSRDVRLDDFADGLRCQLDRLLAEVDVGNR